MSAAQKKSPAHSGSASSPGKPHVNTAKNAKAARQAVAAARSSRSNRLSLIIGISAVAVLALIIGIGLVISNRQTAAPVVAAGPSTGSVATLQDGVMSVTKAKTTPPVFIDLYEDGLCPACALFEAQYGPQIAQYIDSGQLGLRVHMLDFLNEKSASKTYSTRSSAALMAVAADPSTPAGVFLKFHSALYADGTLPGENGSTDLSNQQLADLASKAGATKDSAAKIVAGASLDQAVKTAAANEKTLSDLAAATGASGWGTPTVLKDGKQVATGSTTWLSDLVA